MIESFISHSSDLRSAASKIILCGKNYAIWCFNGTMGAGKTTLIKAICEVLEVTDVVSSPTFSIVNEYLTASNETLYHFDFYRIRHEKEALDIGTDEYLTSGNLCLLEWSEKVPSLLPVPRMVVSLTPIDENKRQIDITYIS